MSENFESKTNQSFSVLLENESGVMEVFLVIKPDETRKHIRVVGSIARSGTLKSTDPQQVSEAINLLKWSIENQCVFEGQTSPTIESAN